MFPGWLFAVLTVLYNEAMLHLWITEDLHFGRFGAVALFALGLGSGLAFLTGLIPKEKVRKWVIVTICVLISAFWLTEYFCKNSLSSSVTGHLPSMAMSAYPR